METYAGRLLADRYRLPRTPSEAFELVESRAFDTASGQEVLVRQVPLPEVVDAEVVDEDGGRARPVGARRGVGTGPRARPRTRWCAGRWKRRQPPGSCRTIHGSIRFLMCSSRATGSGS